MSYDFKPLNLAQIYQSADASVAAAAQMNMLALQSSRMRQEYDREDAMRRLASEHFKVDETTGEMKGDLRGFARAAMAVDPLKAPAYEKMAGEAEKAALERANLQGQIDERRTKQAQERIKLMGDASTAPYLEWKKLTEGGLADPEARQKVQPMYEQALRNLISSGLFTEQQLAGMKLMQTPQFDPMVAKTGMDQAVGASKQLEKYLEERKPKSDLGKLKDDLKAGKIDKATYDAAVEKATRDPRDKPPAGYRFKPDGTTLEPITGGPADTLTATQKDELTSIARTLDTAKRLKAAFKDEFVGFKGTAGEFWDKYGSQVVPGAEGNQERIQFRAMASDLENNYIKAISGATVPESEVPRLRRAIPTPSDSPAQYKAKLDAMEKNLAQLPDIIRTGAKKPKDDKPKADAKAPKVGHVEDGWRFKGGDPSKQENWEKVP